MSVRESYEESKTQDRFFQDLIHFIREEKLLGPQDKVLIAVSGGLDSSVLLHSLFRVMRLFEISIEVAHVDHKTRGAASEREGTWVRVLCERLHLPFHSLALSQKLDKPSQAAFRNERKALLEAKAAELGCTRIALAHHATDNIETLLMRMMSGSGVHGLGAMRPKEGVYIRPLLWATRDELVGYARSHRLSWIEDPTNAEMNYLRNRVRAELLPLCEDIREGSLKNLSRLAQRVCYEEEEFGRWIKEQMDAPKNTLPMALFERWPQALQRRVFRVWLESLGIVGDTQLLEGLVKGQERVHPSGSFLKRSDSWIYFEEKDFGDLWLEGLELPLQKRVNLGDSVAWSYLPAAAGGPGAITYSLGLISSFRSPVQTLTTGRKGFALELAWERAPWPLGIRPLHQVENEVRTRAEAVLSRYRIPEGYRRSWPVFVGLEDSKVGVGVVGLEFFEEYRPKRLERRVSIEHLLEERI